LLSPPFTGEGFLLEQQPRTLCLETELDKKNGKGAFVLSVPLVKRDRIGTRLVGLQGAGHVVHVCLEGCYVCENVVEGSVEPCSVNFLGHFLFGGVLPPHN